VLFGGNAGVEADRDPARIGELAVPAHLRADRGPFGLDMPPALATFARMPSRSSVSKYIRMPRPETCSLDA
jgi:hypothetical protein